MIAENEYIDGNGFIAEVIRTNRIKTADVRVEEGAVSVVVPKDTDGERIVRILSDKRKWIKNKITLHREAIPVSDKQFVSGESFSYLGRNYRLKVKRGRFKPVKLVQGRLVVTVPKGVEEQYMIRNALIRWYKSHAEQKLQEKVERYAEIVGVKPKSIGVREFKSRWGSCHANGDIQFNWKIVIAPNRIVDYVVVHELCHMKQHDHSPKFWKLVSKVIPDYLECKEWLRVNGKYLTVI